MQNTQKDTQGLVLDPKAFRFFPNKHEQKTSFDKKGTRFFFYGQITHDQYQKRKIKQFHEYVANKKLTYNQELFNQQKLLLFLSGNGYKPQKTLQAMKIHQEFRKTYLPSKLTQDIQKVLVFYILIFRKTGYFYPCGRDIHFRPIIVFNAKLIDFKQVDLFLRTTIFVHQQVIANMFIPGQVQNWIIIYDLGGMGITQLPMNLLKTVLGTISQNYGGKLFKLYMVNAPGTIWFSWKLVSGFLDPVTVEKINIFKTNTDQKIFKFCRPSQIQEKYGGKQPNRTSYWPFSLPQGQYDETRLVTDLQYETMLKQNHLANNVIDPRYK